jgi:hypothetical protein
VLSVFIIVCRDVLNNKVNHVLLITLLLRFNQINSLSSNEHFSIVCSFFFFFLIARKKIHNSIFELAVSYSRDVYRLKSKKLFKSIFDSEHDIIMPIATRCQT